MWHGVTGPQWVNLYMLIFIFGNIKTSAHFVCMWTYIYTSMHTCMLFQCIEKYLVHAYWYILKNQDTYMSQIYWSLNICNHFCDKLNLKLNHDDARTWTHITTLCEGNPPVSGTFPSQGPLMQSFDIFFDVSLRKQMAKSSCQWFETPCHSCDVTEMITMKHLYNMVYHNTISYVSWCINKCWI